jgi:hypothetical protein
MQDYFEKPELVEARTILRLVSLGTTTLEGARDLIAIPERQGRALDAFVRTSGKAGASIGHAVAFRRKVLIEFEKLVASANPSEPLLVT